MGAHRQEGTICGASDGSDGHEEVFGFAVHDIAPWDFYCSQSAKQERKAIVVRLPVTFKYKTPDIEGDIEGYYWATGPPAFCFSQVAGSHVHL